MAMSSSSSSRVFLKKYDVFISFRGEDTRENFTRDLYSAMRKENIIAYIDNQLERGDDIWPALVKAIKDSVIAVVVFSERYATSRWCLQELAQIMECRRLGGLAVIPVFYKTNPTDVRKQTGSYHKPFEDHDKREEQDKVESWRDALTQAANISGWESRTQGDNSQVIENLVKNVWRKLCSMENDYQEGLVLIDEQCEAIEGSSGKLGRIGLWGMGGTGKTTIAKALFAKHSPQYDSVCFLKDIREESQIHGLAHIRDKLLFELLKEQVTTSNFSESSLRRRKVLIVLDDVDSSKQLESLCVGLDELGEGSSLIVTTRDKHLLHGIVDKIHELKPWNSEKSYVLFSLAAFKKSEPDDAYEDLSRRAVEYAAGLPLALNFLGSHFYSKNIKFWQSELRNLELRKKSFKEIQDVFKVSYHGLSRQEQAIFLDIAFFFKDRNQDSVKSILDACGFNAASGIEILKDKALITISKTNTIQMLDFLQDMAFDIVRNDVTDPRRGSILMDDDCLQLCNSEGTPEVVEGALLNLSRSSHRYKFNDEIFSLPKLRILKFYVGSVMSTHISFSISENEYDSYSDYYHYDYQLPGSAELKYFEWAGYPSKSLPITFCVKFLVEFRMPYSQVEELWDGTQKLVNLETIDLTECKKLRRLPDLSKASKLKWVNLTGCESLQVLHPSLLSVDTLVTLTLDRCKKLESVMSEQHLSKLQNLNLNDCQNLKEFSVSSDSIKLLDLSKTRVRQLYPSIGRLSNLLWLSLEDLDLENLPDELSCLTSLEELRISDCGVIDKEKLHVVFAGLGSLKVLHLKDCYRKFELPDNISALSSLRELRLDGSRMKKLPTGIKLLENLEILSLARCRELESLPELPLLIKELNADDCTSLETVSTLKTFSVKMKGMEKHISFMNSGLSISSIHQIMEDAMFTMKRAELRNVFVRSSFAVCFPGGGVPSVPESSFITYQSIGSSISINEPHDRSLSHQCLGTVYCVLLFRSSGDPVWGTKIQCQIYGKDGECKMTTWFPEYIGLPKVEHVFLWHGPSVDDAQVFEFFVTPDTGFRIEECAIYHMCYLNSELESLIGEAEMEPDFKSELGVEMQSSLDLPENNNH